MKQKLIAFGLFLNFFNAFGYRHMKVVNNTPFDFKLDFTCDYIVAETTNEKGTLSLSTSADHSIVIEKKDQPRFSLDITFDHETYSRSFKKHLKENDSYYCKRIVAKDIKLSLFDEAGNATGQTISVPCDDIKLSPNITFLLTVNYNKEKEAFSFGYGVAPIAKVKKAEKSKGWFS